MFLQEQYRTDQPSWKCKLTFKILIKTADDFFLGGGGSSFRENQTWHFL